MKRIFNLETLKLELHFDKSEYDSLTDAQKSKLKSNFLWGNKSKCWISRTKDPNLYMARRTAEELGFTEETRVGERLSFAEQIENKQEKAEARAERMENRAENVANEAHRLQKPINDMHGDIAFFTQPNISSSSGRVFTNRRNKMFAQYEKGFETWEKSEYYKDRAETARETAKSEQLNDIAFCERRIKEAQKSIKARNNNVQSYLKTLEKLENGEEVKRYNGELITLEEVQTWIENNLEQIEVLMDKEAFYHDCIAKQGGIKYNKENIKVGFVVKLQRWDDCEVIGTGTKNITYKILNGGAASCCGTASYAEITDVIKSEIKEDEVKKHTFAIGDTFNTKCWDGKKYVDAVFTIIKTTDKSVTLEGNGQKINRKPRFVSWVNQDPKWAISVGDSYNNTFYKMA